MSTRSPRVLSDRRYSATARIGARTCLGENLIHRSGRHGRAIGMSKRGTQSTQLFIARQGLPNANLFFGRSCRRHDIGHGIKRIFHVAGLSLSAQVRHPAPLSTPSRNSGSGDAARRAASTASAVGMYRNTVIVRCCAGFRTPEMPSLSMRSGDPYRDAAPLDHLVGAAEQREREVPPRDFALLRHITSLVFVDCM